jgi:hypothetical protein
MSHCFSLFQTFRLFKKTPLPTFAVLLIVIDNCSLCDDQLIGENVHEVGKQSLVVIRPGVNSWK